MRPLPAVPAVLLTAALVACSAGHQPPTSARPTTLGRPSPTPSASTSAPVTIGTAAGARLAVVEGVGPGVVTVTRVPAAASRMTVRITCVGPGRVRILDRTGGLVLGTSGCAAGVVYSSSWQTTQRDGPTMTVEVAPKARWAVDVWRGRPSPFAPPPAV